jgi:L-ascorbate metabolism protein UlaG (beta-lactamase superfamily)
MSPILATLFTLTLVGGPTVVIDVGGLRLVTDPTFDPAGTVHRQGPVTLTRREGPALAPGALGRIDAVLLSHDGHRDNLDDAGRALLARAGQVLTTPSGAGRLAGGGPGGGGPRVRGLAPWESVVLTGPTGVRVRVTAVPARHGPPGSEGQLGEVTGFVLEVEGAAGPAAAGARSLYVSGDTVWAPELAEVGRRFRVDAALLFGGAASLPELGGVRLTLDGEDAVRLVRALGRPRVLAAHADGWAHLREGPAALQQALGEAGLGALWTPLARGVPTPLRAAPPAPRPGPLRAPAGAPRGAGRRERATP